MPLDMPNLIWSIPELDERAYTLLSKLIYERSGISLGSEKQAFLRARLSRRLQSLKLGSFEKYLDYLNNEVEGEHELARMIDVVSTNMTEFFREPAHFEFLKHSFFTRWKAANEIRILSAGCATGEEPYSLAICALESLGDAARVSIIGGDISGLALTRAKSGIYRLDQLSAISPDRLKRFFLKGVGRNEGLAAVGPRVRSLVRFQHLNLAEPLKFPSRFHAIFCRNVAIYFDRAGQERLMKKFAAALVPRGSLFLGHSESMNPSQRLLSYVQPTVYEYCGS